MKTMLTATCLLGLCVFQHTVIAQAPTITFQTQSLTGISAPVDIINADDGSDRMFIVQQTGIVRVWNRTAGVAPPVFLNMGAGGLNLIATGGEQGLLSMAFHPGYNGVSNRYFFVYFTNTAGNIEVGRLQTTMGNTNLADASSYTSFIIIPHPAEQNHNGGKLNFGTDGYLYFATGDGGNGNDPNNNAQNGMSLLGKMIRLNIDNTSSYGNYAVPADNPYIGNAAFDPRIYAYGLRNPFRWSFDRANGNMWIGDVGQGAREEINFRPAGSTGGINYGWRCYEGLIRTPGVPTCSPTDTVRPVYDYLNPSQGQAVTGGYVYRGMQYPAFRGYYIAADYLSKNVFVLSPNGSGGWNSSIQAGSYNITGFGEAEDGTLYAVANSNVFQVVATGGAVLPVRMISFSVSSLTGSNELKWKTGNERNVRQFHVEYSSDGRSFNRVGAVLASGIESGSSYSYTHTISTIGNSYYRLAIEDNDGAVQYSTVLQVLGQKGKAKIYPTIIHDNNLNISTVEAASMFQLMNSSGAVVFEKRMNGSAGAVSIMLPSLSKGIYIARVVTKSDVLQQKVIVE